MLTENDARALLAQAAGTIEVGPAAPVELARRRTWPVLAAAVATLVAGVGVWVGIAATDDTDAAPDPSVDTQLDRGTVPSIFGHRRAAAARILTDAGLEVRVVERPACDPPGQAIGTLPSTGVRMEPGSVVTLQVAEEGLTMDCLSDLTVPWQLLGLATGEEAAPDLVTGSLTTYFDGERRTVPDATDMKAWGSPSALEALRAAVEWSPGVPRTWQVLETAAPGCDGEPSPSFGLQLAGVRAPVLTRYAIMYDAPDAPCVQLTVAGAFDRPVRGVAVETARLEVGDPHPAPDPSQSSIVPAVFGLAEGEALATLRRAGFTNFVTESDPGCFENGRALRTEPAAGTSLDPSLPVVLIVSGGSDGTCYPLAGSDPLLADLWDLLDFARGGRSPAFADEVITSVNDELSIERDPVRLRSWSSGSPLEMLAAVSEDLRPDLVEQRLLASGWEGPFPADCNIDGVTPGALAAGFDTPWATRAWFAYQSDGEVRACVLVDISLDGRDRIAGLAVRTVDPDSLLPDLATDPVGEGASDLAATFVAFARGELDEPLFLADDVRLYDDGRYVRTASAAELVDRDAWLVCDPASSDSCVGSAIEALAYAVGGVPVAEAVRRGDPPPGTASVVVVGPPEVASCQPRGTVSLYVDTNEQILGVDVVDGSGTFCSEEGLVPPE